VFIFSDIASVTVLELAALAAACTGTAALLTGVAAVSMPPSPPQAKSASERAMHPVPATSLYSFMFSHAVWIRPVALANPAHLSLVLSFFIDNPLSYVLNIPLFLKQSCFECRLPSSATRCPLAFADAPASASRFDLASVGTLVRAP
jgi:hypothetical protein